MTGEDCRKIFFPEKGSGNDQYFSIQLSVLKKSGDIGFDYRVVDKEWQQLSISFIILLKKDA